VVVGISYHTDIIPEIRRHQHLDAQIACHFPHNLNRIADSQVRLLETRKARAAPQHVSLRKTPPIQLGEVKWRREGVLIYAVQEGGDVPAGVDGSLLAAQLDDLAEEAHGLRDERFEVGLVDSGSCV
jgi:hypothetical protein